jgi:FAD/FMN-containing dehydrogenase
VPISGIGDFIVDTNAQLEQTFDNVRMVVFGHLGDGNLHYNVSAQEGMSGESFRQQEARINEVVYESVQRAGGSISAEHGIGQLKVDKNAHYKSATEMRLMARLKTALDPQRLMNPGRVLPSS